MKKLLVLSFLACLFWQARAVENFSQPLTYFLRVRSIPNNAQCLDTAHYWFKPTVSVPVLQLRKSDAANTKLDVSTMASCGGGLTYQRTVIQDGKNYSTFSISLIELLAATSNTAVSADFAAGFLIGLFDNHLQWGVIYDYGNVPNNHRWAAVMSFGINLVNN